MAKLAAIRRASSLVSSFAVEHRSKCGFSDYSSSLVFRASKIE
jgi:hypothetical protein